MFITTKLSPNLNLGWYTVGTTHIRFKLTGSLTGWAGIGFERTNHPHSAMDTYVGWILSSGTAVLQDGYSTSLDIPTSDVTQSAQIVSASQTSSTFTLIFDRALDTQDSKDVVVRTGTPLLLTWAYHLEQKSTSSSIDSYYPQHTHHGSRTIVIQPTSSPAPTRNVPSPSPGQTKVPTLPPSQSSNPSQPPSQPIDTFPTLSPSIIEYNNISSHSIRGDDNFYVSWSIQDSTIVFTYDCQLAGWVGIGFDKRSKIHQSTDTYISWILSSGRGVVVNGYSDEEKQPITDVQQIASVTNASLINNNFQLTFQRPLVSNQSTDYSFTPDEWVLMGWAYHPTNNPDRLPNSSIHLLTHTARGSMYKNVYTGESKATPTPLLPSTYYLILMLAGFIGFATFQRLKCKLSWKWLYEKSKLYPRYANIELFTILGILFLNSLCIGLGTLDNFTQSQIWGYMSTANSLIVAIPATRNSIITWVSGIPMDQTLMYHRWLGRITIIQACVHFAFSIGLPEQFKGQNLYGTFALASGCTIGVTSVQWIRRYAFNFFFTMHHLFIIYYVMGSLHTRTFFNLALVGMCLYGLDLILRMWRGLFPRKILYAEQLHSRLFKVRIPKPSVGISPQIGQYVFLNFPQVSYFEWHPFTLVSAPNDPYYEVYIKNLGDYTRELLWYLSQAKRPVWVRVDGPYGKWPFDYKAYSHITFICGGVGITPCISLIRHVYGSGSSDAQQLQHIYLVWCCAKETDAQWINEEFAHIIETEYPKLHVYVFITDQRYLKNQSFHTGRPDIQSIFNLMENQMTDTHKGCVFACGPKSLTRQAWETWSARKMNQHCVYHQEIFEF